MNCRRPHCAREAQIRGLCRRDYFRATVGQDPEIASYMLDANVDDMRWNPSPSLTCECDEPRASVTNDLDDQCGRCFRVIAERVIARRAAR